MTSMVIALVLKPILAIFILLPGALFVYWLRNRMPECKLKRILLISWKV